MSERHTPGDRGRLSKLASRPSLHRQGGACTCPALQDLCFVFHYVIVASLLAPSCSDSAGLTSCLSSCLELRRESPRALAFPCDSHAGTRVWLTASAGLPRLHL